MCPSKFNPTQTNPTQPNPTQPMGGPNPCPCLRETARRFCHWIFAKSLKVTLANSKGHPWVGRVQVPVNILTRSTVHAVAPGADLCQFALLSRMKCIGLVLVLLYFEWKLSNTRASLSNSMQFWGITIYTNYLTALTCKLCISFYTKLWNFWHITRLSIISRCKVIWSQISPVFGPRCTFLERPVKLMLSCNWYVTLRLTVFEILAVNDESLGLWGYRPQTEENMSPIGVTVAEISVTKQKNKYKAY